MTKEKFFYIYNQRQADYFYHSGVEIAEIGKGRKGDTFIKFKRDEKAEIVFEQWINLKDTELLK